MQFTIQIYSIMLNLIEICFKGNMHKENYVNLTDQIKFKYTIFWGTIFRQYNNYLTSILTYKIIDQYLYNYYFPMNSLNF